MNRWKTLGKRLLFPPGWLLVILTVVSAAGLVRVFSQGLEETVLAYGLYALSAYTLTVVCVFLGRTLPRHYRKTRQRVYAHPLGHRYMTDAAFKVRVSLYISLGINLVYSVFKLAAGVYFASFWWGAVAVYYLVLSVIRFFLLRYMRTEQSRQTIIAEYRSYRLCGALMVLLNLSLTGIVFQMVWKNQTQRYPEVIVITMAAYTFYTVTVSVVDIIRYRKYKRPVLSAAKAIRLAAALVSLLSLETVMLARYSVDPAFTQLMTALTGAGVCVAVLGMSSYMIVRSTARLNALETEQEQL